MKKSFLIPIMLSTFLVSCNKKSSSKINFVFNNHNFDTIYPIESSKNNFVYINIGTEEFVIHDVIVSCGCTIPYYSKKPLAPLETDSILVEYDSKNNKGYFLKEIMIYSNAKDSPHKLFVKGFSL